MHLTSYEIQLIPSVVAALAIVGGYLGITSANRNARLLASEQYLQKRRTKAYLRLLANVNYYESQLLSLTDPDPGVARSIAPPDLTYAEQAANSAQIYHTFRLRYMNSGGKFVSLSNELADSIKSSGRISPGPSFTQSTIQEVPALAPLFSAHGQAKGCLIVMVRSQLGVSNGGEVQQ